MATVPAANIRNAAPSSAVGCGHEAPRRKCRRARATMRAMPRQTTPRDAATRRPAANAAVPAADGAARNFLPPRQGFRYFPRIQVRAVGPRPAPQVHAKVDKEGIR